MISASHQTTLKLYELQLSTNSMLWSFFLVFCISLWIKQKTPKSFPFNKLEFESVIGIIKQKLTTETMTFNTLTRSYQRLHSSYYKSFLLFSLFNCLSLSFSHKTNQMRLQCFVCLLLFLIIVSVQLDETLSLRRDMTKLLEIQDKIHERLATAPSLPPPLSSPSSPFPKMVIISHIFTMYIFICAHVCKLWACGGLVWFWCRWGEWYTQ